MTTASVAAGTRAPLVIESPAEMRAFADQARARGETIVLVPTMGYLHEGHISLLTEGRKRGRHLVMSLFVNPTQFAPGEDLDRYPRDLAGDLAKAARAGADVVFAPDRRSMYPVGAQTFVEVGDVARGLCGDRRPGHFRGVATVVCKLFNIVKPQIALFGEKDFQQLLVIRRMNADLDLGVDVVGLPTVREPDGLAMSSRNSYLSPADRQRAAAIQRGLRAALSLHVAGERNPASLLSCARDVIGPAVDRIDYLELRDAETLAPVESVVPAGRGTVMLAAAFVGATRLIDNVRL